MSTSQFAVYQLKKKPELRNLLFRTYEELAQDQIPVQVANYEQVYLGTMKPGETPEQIKKDLEQKQPHNYKGHAVSTSDVLILNDNGVTTTYYVNKDTFIEIPDFMKVTSSESGGLTKDTVGYEIEGKDGTWEVVDYLLVEGKNYFLSAPALADANSHESAVLPYRQIHYIRCLQSLCHSDLKSHTQHSFHTAHAP